MQQCVAFIPQDVRSAFRKTGKWPLNKDAVTAKLQGQDVTLAEPTTSNPC